jgi:glycosyltransferase involved in cell wall biosynthesis
MIIDVAQLGARMHYAVPEILFNNGYLNNFYTDLYNKGLSSSLIKNSKSKYLSSLRNRKSAILNEKNIFHNPLLALIYKFQISKCRNQAEKFYIYNQINSKFCKWVIKNIDWNKIDVVYSFNSASLEIIEKAHQEGKRVIMEQCIAPFEIEQKILFAEYEKYPIWNNKKSNEYEFCEDYENYIEREKTELSLADQILCPSNFVAESIERINISNSNVKIIPYGFTNYCNSQIKKTSNTKLNVLTVGAGVRKGTHYILDAAKSLSNFVEFTLIGDLGTQNKDLINDISEHMNYVGVVNRNDVKKYYLNADVFLLPSLCEGSATVIYEAISYGLPVITTFNSGSMIKNMFNGLIIEHGSSDAIKEAILELFNSELLSFLTENVKNSQFPFSKEAYAERLISNIR